MYSIVYSTPGSRHLASTPGQVTGGYYADMEADCQLFHVCVQVSEYEVRGVYIGGQGWAGYRWRPVLGSMEGAGWRVDRGLIGV